MTAEGLRRRRRDIGLPQGRVAEMLGVNRVTFVRWEAGSAPIPIRRIAELDRLYGVLEGAVREFEEWREPS